MTKNSQFPGWDRIDGSHVPEAEVSASFQAVMSRAEALEEYLRERKRKKRLIWKRSAVAIAAAVALILVPLISIRYAISAASEEPGNIGYLQCATACGETREVILPDDSHVTLNAQSVLIYPESFGKERLVFLSGEAIFDVTASEESPFEVRTSDITVMVHGTLFNVNAYYDSPRVTATLSRGAVSLWPNDEPHRAVKLNVEEQFSYERATGAITTVREKSRESMSWANGDLYFRSASILDIIRVVERHFGVQVYLATDKYDNAVITARFIHGETVDELMKAICDVVPNMKYTRNNQSIFIK